MLELICFKWRLTFIYRTELTEAAPGRRKGRKRCNIYDGIVVFRSPTEGQTEETILPRRTSEQRQINNQMYADGATPDH